MSFEVGRLSAALTLEGIPEFHRDLDAAGRKLTETGSRGASFGKAGEAAVKSAAGATTGLVAAAGSYLAILTKTGVGYNSMQQNSRAALKVLLGGTEAANAQMSKLDDFARNSPFSKSVFIEAQQQLIGFGMEAGKVVPTLDAIQQGVAAMGGSNQQISEVVNILAKVQSTGKFTAQTLNELGYRGVDAATLMGDAMGKTAAQMREDISEGAIGGAEAIDVLVEAMKTRFGGAADGVKEQWSGAVDRIKAAQRDLGAHIAEPFVSAQGGGMAVTWGNQVADVLRAIEKQAVPVMGILTQRGMPFFSSLTQGLDTAAQATARWDADSLNVSLDKMSNHAPGIAALAGATLALGAQVGPLGKMFSVLGISANPVLAAFVGLAAASPELRDSLMGILKAGEPLLPVVGDLAGILSGTLNSALPVVAGGLDVVASVLEVVLGIISKIPAPVLVAAAAFLAMQKGMGALTPTFRAVSTAMVSFQDEMKLQQHLAGMSTSAMTELGVATVDVAQTGGRELGAFGAAASVAGSKITGLGNALKTAFLSNPIGIALTGVSVLMSIWAAENAKAQQKVQEHQARVAELRGTLDETSGALTAASKNMLGQVVATDEMAAALKGTGVSGQAFVTALTDGGAAAKLFETDVMQSARSMEAYEKYSGHWEATADKLGVSLDTLVRGSLGFADAQSEVEAAVRASSNSVQDDYANTARGIQTHLSAQHEVIASYEAQRSAIEMAQREQARLRESTREHEAAMSDAARSNLRFNDALAAARDTTSDAETRVRALKQALDELNGGTRSQAQLTRDLNEQQRNLNEMFTQTDDAGNNVVGALVKASGEIDTTSAAGGALFDQLSRVNNEMTAAIEAADRQAKANGEAGLSMEEAAAAAKPYQDALREAGEAAGFSDELIAAMTATALDVPSIIAFALTDNGTVSETGQRVLGLMGQLAELPKGETITINAEGAEETVATLEALGVEVELSPDKKNYVITSEGAEVVAQQLTELTETTPPDKLFKIDADAAKAFEGIDGVNVKVIDKKTAYVWGDNTDAMEKIEGVAKKEAVNTVKINGNTKGFEDAWNSVVGRVGKAWVSIFGEKGNMSGGMYSPDGQHFAAGGFPSGMYSGVNGGIRKTGIDGTPHVFAEAEMGVPWEAYISGKPEFRERNIGLAFESLRRLGVSVQTDRLVRAGLPSVPAVSVFGAHHFAAGGMTGSTPLSVPNKSVQVERKRGRRGPLANVINVGVDAKTNDIRNLATMLDRLSRGS